MLLTEDKQIDIFVASKIGSFKHIKFHTDGSKNTKRCIENLVPIKSLQKDDCITCMEWGNEAQTEILIGQRNQQIKVYDTLQGFQKSYTADFGTGSIVGLGRYKKRMIAALSSGTVKIWRKKEDCVIDTGGKLDVMKMCPDDPTLFATGGEENDVTIWRVGTPTPVFSAKNLAHDWLQLRRPVWVSGLAWAPGGAGGAVLAAASRHGYVRLYDSRAQRRPVCSVEFPKMAATSIAAGFNERCFLVGFGRGQLHQVDLRVGKPDKGYKGAVGAITSIAIADVGSSVVVSSSADRHIRVHRHQSKELIHKQYLTSKLSCVLVQSKSSTPLLNVTEQEQEQTEQEQEQETEIKEEDDMDQLFDRMETIGEKTKRKEHISTSEPEIKKTKPSIEGSTIDLDLEENEAEDNADAIKKLLRSTEKQKKKLEKKKKEKKAKSVFHNA